MWRDSRQGLNVKEKKIQAKWETKLSNTASVLAAHVDIYLWYWLACTTYTEVMVTSLILRELLTASGR